MWNVLLLAREEGDLRETRILSGDEHVLDEGVGGARMVHVASQVARLLRIHDVGLRVAVAIEIAQRAVLCGRRVFRERTLGAGR